MQILCLIFLTLVNLSFCQNPNIANDSANVFFYKDPDADINAFLAMLKQGYLYKEHEHVPSDLDKFPQPLVSGGHLFLILALYLTLVFSFAMYGFIQCVKSRYRYKGKNPIVEIV